MLHAHEIECGTMPPDALQWRTDKCSNILRAKHEKKTKGDALQLLPVLAA